MLLELQEVSKRYESPDGVEAVEIFSGLEFEAAEEDTVAIVGPSGSGKSTFLNLVGGLDRPSSGRILYNGADIFRFDERKLAEYHRQEVGFVFQLHHLLPQCTVFENVLVPTLTDKSRNARSEYESRARDLLEEVGLEHRINHRPGELSGGERQRAAVARALINRPKLLLADEPTGSLDHRSSGALADLLVDLNQREHVTLIMVTHALEVARRMKRVYEVSDGRLLAPAGAA